jgi:hypothetical protein
MTARMLLPALVAAALFVEVAVAQQVTVGVPGTSMSSQFFENFGVNFGFRLESANSMMFFRNGLSATPMFGGLDPSSTSTFGVGGQNGNGSWNLGFTASQGSSRSNVSTTPFLTLPNGGFGFINNTQQRPFVTGLVPIVGDQVHREILRRQFAAAAAAVVEERRQVEQAEVKELARLKAVSRSRKRSKPVDPPLVLGR